MLPLTTTRITILRVPEADVYSEPYQGEDKAGSDRYVVASGVPAAIGGSLQGTVVGRERRAGGEQSKVSFSLRCNPTDLTHQDWVKDEKTGEVYEVEWVARRHGLGLDFIQAQMSQVEGAI